jgi:hypothetical protein
MPLLMYCVVEIADPNDVETNKGHVSLDVHVYLCKEVHIKQTAAVNFSTAYE